MKPESTEDLRRRLLQDEQVQMMISMRAYEIYQMRGSQPGQDAENWFRAENEILTFLIQEESRREAYSHDQDSGDEIDESRSESDLSKSTPPSEGGGARPQAFEPQTTSEISDRLDQPTAQLAEERAESQSALGVWSPAEPASAETAKAPEEKKTGSRATAKSAEPRKRKTAASASKEGAEKKSTARRTASKKSTEGESKPKTTRRKPAPPKNEE